MQTDLAHMVEPEPEVIQNADKLLQAADYKILNRLKLFLGHVLLPAGSFVLVPDCGNGHAVSLLAALNPRLHFMGIDEIGANIKRATKKYSLPNLEFCQFGLADVHGLKEKFDAVLLYEQFGVVYSDSQYDERSVTKYIETYRDTLKPKGYLVVMDYALPDPDTIVLLEFPNPIAAIGAYHLHTPENKIYQHVQDMADLKWFADNAHANVLGVRGKDNPQGFHLEQLAPKKPHTALFRLPMRFAYEYLIRKRELVDFRSNIQTDFTSLSVRDFDRYLHKGLGLRLAYKRQWYDVEQDTAILQNTCRIQDVQGTILPWPALSVFVAQSVGERQALQVQEHRVTGNSSHYNITSMQDTEKSAVYDLVTPQSEKVDLLLWTKNTAGGIDIILETDALLPIANSLARTAYNLDGRVWSGHGFALPSTDAAKFMPCQGENTAAAIKFLHQNFAVQPVIAASFKPLLQGYAAPDLLDMQRNIQAIEISANSFTASAVLQTFPLEDVLRAAMTGYIPDAWLQIALSELAAQNGINLDDAWLEPELPIGKNPPRPEQILRIDKILNAKNADDIAEKSTSTLADRLGKRFRVLRVPTGRVRAIQSDFMAVQSDNERFTQRRIGEIDHVTLPAEMTNIAAVLTLTQDFDGMAMLGFQMDSLPVPIKNGDDSPMLHLPTLPLPANLTDMRGVRSYLAEFFGVSETRVVPLGESFFSDNTVFPQRIYPFAVADAPWNGRYDIKYAPIYFLEDLTKISNSTSLLWRWGFFMARRCLKARRDHLMEPRTEFKNMKAGKDRKPKKLAPRGRE